MDADEARQQLALSRRGALVRPVDRRAIGLAVVMMGLAMASTVVLRTHSWNMVPFFLVLIVFIAVDATRRTRPRSRTRVMVAALGVSLVWAVVESIWFGGDVWDSASFRWLSGALFGAPVVLAGLYLLRKPSS